jgi:hypothetical protein
MSDPFDPLCAECGLPRSHPDHADGDADVDDERAARADFDARVAARTDELLAEHRAVAQLADFKMGRGPKPRTQSLDALERARIRKLAEARDFKHRVDAKVFAHRVANGTAEFVIQTKDGGMMPADPVLIAAKIREARADIHSGKDATWPNLEFRNGPTGDA